jgi:hypothetical protein
MNKPGSATQDRNDGPANLGATLLRVAAASSSQRSQEKIQTFFKPSAC